MKIFYHDDYTQLTQTPGHPECPERMEAIVSRLPEVISPSDMMMPRPATEEQLALAHDPNYVSFIKDFVEGYMDADSFIHPHTYDMASLAAGGAILAAEFSFDNKVPTYALTRPPGHHAGRDYGGGFCYFNNIAIAAAGLLEKVSGQTEPSKIDEPAKLAIIDIDVHHGNGTNDIFASSPEVLYISTHQYGIYPGTGHFKDVGRDEGEGFNVNVPLPAGSGDATFDHAFDRLIIPVLRQFKPEALLISFGGDAHYKDMLASLTLSSQGYLNIMAKLNKLGAKVCDNRTSIVLEGGYHTGALAEVVCGTIALFDGKEFDMKYDEVMDDLGIGNEYVDKAIEIQSEYWEL